MKKKKKSEKKAGGKQPPATKPTVPTGGAQENTVPGVAGAPLLPR